MHYSLKYVALVHVSLSYTQVFVFHFINDLCSVKLGNTNITKHILKHSTTSYKPLRYRPFLDTRRTISVPHQTVPL